jgi:hypothetical protein
MLKPAAESLDDLQAIDPRGRHEHSRNQKRRMPKVIYVTGAGTRMLKAKPAPVRHAAGDVTEARSI